MKEQSRFRTHGNTAGLDYYLRDNHWNCKVNNVIYQKLLTCYDGMELGKYLYEIGSSMHKPINDYSPLYGEMFNEAYQLCAEIVDEDIPETKISYYLSRASKISVPAQIADKVEPNALDLIQAYHVLCMVIVLLSLEKKNDSAIRFLNHVSFFDNQTYYIQVQHFNIYCLHYQIFVYCIIHSRTLLGKEYPYDEIEQELVENCSWYDNISVNVAKEKETNITQNIDYESLIDKLNKIDIEDTKQKKGYAFEKYITLLFDAFSLNPRVSYKTRFNQIDGSFSIDNQTFLIEAKYTNNPINKNPLVLFEDKIKRKSSHARGLFLTHAPLSKNAVKYFENSGSTFIVMYTDEIDYILRKKMNLPDLIRKKIRHLDETGNILFQTEK